MSAHFKQDSNHPVTGEYGRNSAYYQAGHGSHHHSSKKRGHSRRAFVIGGVCIAAVAAAGAATPAMASNVIDDLKTRAGSVSDLLNQTIDAFKGLDFQQAYELALKTSDEVKDFDAQLQGPLWGAAELVPVLGGDVKAARTLVDMLGNLIDEALIPMSQTLSGFSVDQLVHKDGDGQTQVDLATLQTLVNAVKQAMPAVSDAVDTLEGIGELHVPQLASVVESAKEKVSPLTGKMDKIGEILDVFPNMLGASGDRVYVVVAQNNVEIRSTGGFAGQCCRVAVSNGIISLGEVHAIYDFIPNNEWACVDLTDEELALYGNSVGYMAGNTGCIPDFPRVCDIWNQLWATYQGEYVNGFIALDPIFLQMLMGLTGGAYMYDGTLMDGANTVRVLLHDTYWNYMDDPNAMDAYFSAAASTALDCIMENLGSMSLTGLMQVINDGIDGYHLLAWFADASEQSVFEGLGATGEVKLDPAAPQLGIYVNNESWSKIEWWLNMDFAMSGPTSAFLSSEKTYECTLTLSNAATWDEINVCNDYMVGSNSEKYAADDILDRLAIYAPAGGRIEVTDHNDFFNQWDDCTYKGLQVVTGQVHNEIDQPCTISFTVTVPAEATQDLTVRMTPTVQNYR